MFLWLKTLYRKRAVTWPFNFYTIIWTLSLIAVIKTGDEKISLDGNQKHKLSITNIFVMNVVRLWIEMKML